MSPNVACTKSADDTCKMTQMIITPQMGNICNPSGHKDGNPPPVFHTNISSAKALPALRCAKSRHLRELLIGSCHFPPTSESCTRLIGYNVNVSSWCIPEQRWRGIEGKAFNRCMLTPSIQFSVCSLFNESFVLDIVLFVCGVLWVRGFWTICRVVIRDVLSLFWCCSRKVTTACHVWHKSGKSNLLHNQLQTTDRARHCVSAIDQSGVSGSMVPQLRPYFQGLSKLRHPWQGCCLARVCAYALHLCTRKAHDQQNFS